MSRQHAAPVLVPPTGPATTLAPLRLGGANEGGGHGWSEAEVQALIQAYPACLPIAEIDPLFANPVPICTELNTTAGPIDNLLVTASGLPVLVECKLWRNPQARREVVGQILDYAKELSRWSSSDLQREVSRRLGRPGNAVLDLVRAAGHEVDEIGFNDALTLNLHRGRFLLLIVGDGIREGVEAIAEYLQVHAGLHFTLGLVELPIYAMPNGGRLVVPRVVARTALITRYVVEAPSGHLVSEEAQIVEPHALPLASSALSEKTSSNRREVVEFWSVFLDGLQLDDPEQPVPSASGAGHLRFVLPAPRASVWITTYRTKSANRLGIFLTHSRDPIGSALVRSLAKDRAIQRSLSESFIGRVLGTDLRVFDEDGKTSLASSRDFGDLDDSDIRTEAYGWLREQLNRWVNVLRPSVREAAQQLEER